MILSILLFISSYVILLIEPLSAVQLIAAGVFIISGVFNLLKRTHLTYVLVNPITGQVYIGRTSGFGEPAKILKRRMYGHRYKILGFCNPMVDKAMQGLNARPAIRGREQQLIDYYGGIGHSKVANIRRGVAKRNPFGDSFHQASDANFGNISKYTGVNKKMK